MAAGVYVPTLAKELLDNAKDTVPLKGIAVGDPCTDNVAQSDSMDGLWYGHKMGLVPDQLFDLLWNKCGARAPNEVALGGSSLWGYPPRSSPRGRTNFFRVSVPHEPGMNTCQGKPGKRNCAS